MENKDIINKLIKVLKTKEEDIVKQNFIAYMNAMSLIEYKKLPINKLIDMFYLKYNISKEEYKEDRLIKWWQRHRDKQKDKK